MTAGASQDWRGLHLIRGVRMTLAEKRAEDARLCSAIGIATGKVVSQQAKRNHSAFSQSLFWKGKGKKG